MIAAGTSHDGVPHQAALRRVEGSELPAGVVSCGLEFLGVWVTP
jgi:hypothetical protein